MFGGMKWLTVIGLVIALTACGGGQRLSAKDDAECQEFGFTLGTEAYAGCRLKLKEIRAIRSTGSKSDALQNYRNSYCSYAGC